jgi:hypothetical protein
MTAIETTIKIDDAIVTFRSTTVPAKFRPASEEIAKEIIGMIITGAMIGETIIEKRQALVDKIIDPDFPEAIKCITRKSVERALSDAFFRRQQRQKTVGPPSEGLPNFPSSAKGDRDEERGGNKKRVRARTQK